MEKKIIFRGIATALITPFKNGDIDYDALSDIIEMQIGAGISALVIGGTTAEAATLSDEERYSIYSFSRDCVKGRVPIVLGTGTNDTRVAIKHTKMAEKIGCDAILAVTPYYNKGTVRGVCEHYRQIAEASILPVILYNVPARTGVNLTVEQLLELSEIPNIVGIKEASESLDRLVEIAGIGKSLHLYAGNDSHTFTTLALGGLGTISVASNIVPGLMMKIATEFFAGRYEQARDLQIRLYPFIKALFKETNPAPIKYAMSLLSMCENEVRLPLAPVENATQVLIESELKKLI